MDPPWYLAGEFLVPTVILAGAFASSAVIEGVKRTFLRGMWQRRREQPDPYYRGMGWTWVGSIVIGTVAGAVIGSEVGASPTLVALAGGLGGVGARPLYNKILQRWLDRAGNADPAALVPRDRSGNRRGSDSTWFGR